MSVDQVFEAQAAHEEELLEKRNVVGVAVGYKGGDESSGEMAVVVLVERKVPLAALAAEDVVPRTIDGVRTDVIEIGYLRALGTPQPGARDRHRPTIPAGVSIGHFKVTAGTLGAIVRDRATNQPYILSNNHVLANSNDAATGDPILQPAAMDGGRQPGDTVAVLDRFIPLRYLGDPVTTPPTPVTPPPPNPVPPPPVTPTPQPSGGNALINLLVAIINLIVRLLGGKQQVVVQSQVTEASAASAAPAATPEQIVESQSAPENRMDCALARPVDPAMFSPSIMQIGAVNGTKAVTIGMRVRKYGRTTEYTEGRVTLVNATVNVGYSTAAGAKTARFTGQVIAEPISKGGDSGSLVVAGDENKAVGLLFAGSELATIFTPIDPVLDALNVRL